jgi:hypothetical protein
LSSKSRYQNRVLLIEALEINTPIDEVEQIEAQQGRIIGRARAIGMTFENQLKDR